MHISTDTSATFTSFSQTGRHDIVDLKAGGLQVQWARNPVNSQSATVTYGVLRACSTTLYSKLTPDRTWIYVVLGIKPGRAACRANACPFVLILWPAFHYFKIKEIAAKASAFPHCSCNAHFAGYA